MNKLLTIILITILLISIACPAYSASRVGGYYRKNGTYVAPHYRSSSDGFKYNNYSTKGNYNPYTGKTGTVNPYTYRPKYRRYRY